MAKCKERLRKFNSPKVTVDSYGDITVGKSPRHIRALKSIGKNIIGILNLIVGIVAAVFAALSYLK